MLGSKRMLTDSGVPTNVSSGMRLPAVALVSTLPTITMIRPSLLAANGSLMEVGRIIISVLFKGIYIHVSIKHTSGIINFPMLG
jgi:hypothetical protein